MRRPLWLALACVAGLSLYVMNTEDDDSLLASDRPAASERAPARASARDAAADRRAGKSASTGAAKRAAKGAKAAADPRLSQSLVRHVQAWQLRSADEGSSQAQAHAQANASPASAWAAWAAVAPPPPPEPPPQAALEVPAPVEPVAPPFPHEWVGRFNDLTDTKVLERAVLAGPRKTMVVQSGDVVEGQWRIDGIHERRMTVTYLPLNQPQEVAMK